MLKMTANENKKGLGVLEPL